MPDDKITSDQLEYLAQRVVALLKDEGVEIPNDGDEVGSNACFRGNSVGYIHDKMLCYQAQVGMGYKALRALGFDPSASKDNDEMREHLKAWTAEILAKLGEPVVVVDFQMVTFSAVKDPVNKDAALKPASLEPVDARPGHVHDLPPCPYCPTGGDVLLACTDLENEKEYQVWCRECWAHGSSRETADAAVKAWNEVSVAVRGVELTRGEKYILLKDHDGQKKGQWIIFRWCTEDGKYNVFNPEGEADMQSAFSIKVSETAYFVGKVSEGASP